MRKPANRRRARTFQSFDASEPRHSRLLLRNTHSDLLSSVFGSAHSGLLGNLPANLRLYVKYQCRASQTDAALSKQRSKSLPSTCASLAGGAIRM